MHTWLNGFPLWLRQSHSSVVSFKKRTPAQRGTPQSDNVQGRLAKSSLTRGERAPLCTCTQPALGCPTICRSCIKMAEEHGHGPSTLHSFRPSPREAPQTQLETACACVCPCPPKPQLSAKAMPAEETKVRGAILRVKSLAGAYHKRPYRRPRGVGSERPVDR